MYGNQRVLCCHTCTHPVNWHMAMSSISFLHPLIHSLTAMSSVSTEAQKRLLTASIFYPQSTNVSVLYSSYRTGPPTTSRGEIKRESDESEGNKRGRRTRSVIESFTVTIFINWINNLIGKLLLFCFLETSTGNWINFVRMDTFPDSRVVLCHFHYILSDCLSLLLWQVAHKKGNSLLQILQSW